MDFLTQGHTSGLRHCHVLDSGHECGHHLLFPYSRFHARPAIFSLRQHSDDQPNRPLGTGDLWLLGILTAFVCILFTLFLRPIQSVAFDRTFSLSQHLPVALIEYMMMALIAMTIVATLKMVGIVLAISLLTIPQMTANLFTYSFKKIIWLSIGIGFLGCLGGLFISYHWKVPSGASIIFFSILIYAVCKIGKSCCRKKS